MLVKLWIMGQQTLRINLHKGLHVNKLAKSNKGGNNCLTQDNCTDISCKKTGSLKVSDTNTIKFCSICFLHSKSVH